MGITMATTPISWDTVPTTMVMQPFITTAPPSMANKPRIEVLQGERSLGPRLGKTQCGGVTGITYAKREINE